MAEVIVSPAIVIVVFPTGKSTQRGPTYVGTVDGRRIVEHSTQPFLDGARVLLAEGADPDSKFTMRHSGSDVDALTSTVGYAAKWTVVEGDYVPRLRPYVPYNAEIHAPERAPVSFEAAPAP